MPKVPNRIVEVSTEEEYKKALAEATGPVVIEFTMQGCEACDEEKPEMEAIVKKCASGLTIIRADVDKLSGLADSFKCDATPTLFYAGKVADLTPGTATELEDAAALRRRIKCSR